MLTVLSEIAMELSFNGDLDDEATLEGSSLWPKSRGYYMFKFAKEG